MTQYEGYMIGQNAHYRWVVYLDGIAQFSARTRKECVRWIDRGVFGNW